MTQKVISVTGSGQSLHQSLHQSQSSRRFTWLKRLNEAGLVTTVILPLALVGCASMGAKPAEVETRVAPIVSSGGQTLPDGSIRHDTDNARVAQLWSAAESARQEKDLDSADSYIAEALTVNPNDAVLWSRAAELKLGKLELSLAENFAAKSLAYETQNRVLMHRNWLIIEHARELRGDLLGVRDAHKMVQQYQY